MTIKEFIDQGYSIVAHESLIETQNIDLDDFARGVSLDECNTVIVDDTPNDDLKTTYDILDPNGDLMGPYDAASVLTTEEAVKEFIEKL